MYVSRNKREIIDNLIRFLRIELILLQRTDEEWEWPFSRDSRKHRYRDLEKLKLFYIKYFTEILNQLEESF